MSIPETFPSGWTSGKNAPARTHVEPPESIGSPYDAPAASVSAENSAFALLKGIAAALGVPTGSGAGDTVGNSRTVYHDPLATLGSMTDAPASLAGAVEYDPWEGWEGWEGWGATDASESVDRASAISVLKGIAGELGP
jgi:hypothetical protein